MRTEVARAQVDRAVLFVAPVVFLAGLVAHPFVRNYMDTEVIATAIIGAPGRWGMAHLIIAVGVGLVLLAALAIRRQFQIAGEHRWSGIGLALLIVGGVLLGAVVGAEITLSAVVNSGSDVLAVLTEAETWTRPLFIGGIALFALGWLSFAGAFYKVAMLGQTRSRLAIMALIAIPVGTFIPQTTGSYVYGVAVLVVSWLVGLGVTTRSSAEIA